MRAAILGAALASAAATLSTPAAATPAAQADRVVVAYNTPPEWANWKSVVADFRAKTGITVPPDNKNSGQTLTQLLAELGNPQADAAYFGITFGIEAAERGVLQPYRPALFEEIPADLKHPEGYWWTIHSGAVAFMVNKDFLDGAPVPTSWADLLRPEYRGKVGVLDPTSAFTGFASATAVNLAMGGTLENWDPGIAYLQQLYANDLILPKQTSYTRVVQGEIPILIDYDFNAYRLKYVDAPNAEVVIPAEGSLVFPYVVGMVNGAPRPDDARLFLDYLLSDDGQRAWGDGFVRPVRPGLMSAETASRFLPDSEYARATTVDYQRLTQVQPYFTERWNAEVAR